MLITNLMPASTSTHHYKLTYGGDNITAAANHVSRAYSHSVGVHALLVIPNKESKGVIWYATREESSRPLIWKRVQVEVIWLAFRPNLLGHSETEDSVIDSLGKYLPFSRNDSVSDLDERILFCEKLVRLLLQPEESLDDSSTPLDELLSDVSLTTKQRSRTDRDPTKRKSTPHQRTNADNTSQVSTSELLELAESITRASEQEKDRGSDVTIASDLKVPVKQFREGGDLFASSLETSASGPQPFADGQKRYDKIRVLLIRWKEHTLSFGEVTRAREAFESYNYEVEEFQIPKSKPLQSLGSKIRASAADIKTTPNLNTLLIIWYYGHGGLSANRGNDLFLCSHEEGGTCVRWSNVAKAILQVRTDVLTILDCCRAGASVISEDILQPFIASNKDYAKWVLTGSGFESSSWSGHKNALAYAIADILDRHLDTMDLDTEWLHRQATCRAVTTYIRETPLTSTPGLLRMISGRPGPIMLHPLPSTLAPRGTKRSRPFSSTDSVDEPPKTRVRAS
ncbi:hypothetical protein CcaCcLH18_11025 [Colletotrichum camelliae]|nr:hypothetical protein CcaCcLH18_11025 [Colletotrichum camelliae]